MLKMKSRCQRCNTLLSNTAEAYICSYECTFCDACAHDLSLDCPNCSGNLVMRPLRTKSLSRVIVNRVLKMGKRQ